MKNDTQKTLKIDKCNSCGLTHMIEETIKVLDLNNKTVDFHLCWSCLDRATKPATK